MEVILLRHAETPWNAAGRYQGWEDIELSCTGRASLPALARSLEDLLPGDFDLWSSDLRRTVQTARLLFGRDPIADRRLRELDFGEFSGNTYDENVARFGQRFEDWVRHRGHPAPPGGERLEDFLRRTRAWLDAVRRSGRSVVTVTHGGVIRALARPYVDEEHWPENGEATVLRFPSQGSPEVIRWRPPDPDPGA